MIAADTSSLINFLSGAGTPDADLVREALRADRLWLPPPARTELISRPVVGATIDALVLGARLLAITPGYWDRAGHNRRVILSKGLRARLADTLIAQCCIDADAPLITSNAEPTEIRQLRDLLLVGDCREAIDRQPPHLRQRRKRRRVERPLVMPVEAHCQ